MADWSKTWTFFEGEWHEGNVPLWGVRTHAIWLGSSVFDGAREAARNVADPEERRSLLIYAEAQQAMKENNTSRFNASTI